MGDDGVVPQTFNAKLLERLQVMVSLQIEYYLRPCHQGWLFATSWAGLGQFHAYIRYSPWWYRSQSLRLLKRHFPVWNRYIGACICTRCRLPKSWMELFLWWGFRRPSLRRCCYSNLGPTREVSKRHELHYPHFAVGLKRRDFALARYTRSWNPYTSPYKAFDNIYPKHYIANVGLSIQRD